MRFELKTFRKKRTFQTFQTCTGTVVDLEPGTSYIFKVCLIKADGKVAIFGENSEQVITMDESKREEDRPGKPFVEEIFTDSVDIAWEGLKTFQPGDGYQVHITNEHTGMSGMKLFETNCGKIGGLQPGSEYVFKVRSVKSEGEVSTYSENSEVVKTKEKTKVDPPGEPRVGNIKTDSVDIFWDDMPNFCSDDVYQVHIKNVQKGDERTEKFKTNGGKITGLQPSTQFVFKVRLVMANAEESEYSEEVTAHTTDSYALVLLREAKLVKEYTNGLRVYQLPMKELQEARNKDAKTRKFHLGPREENALRQKTIMLVGATGTGKSTFVDCLANYILGVRQEDTFRFTVTQDEDRVRQHNQAESQTDWISCYSFNPQPGNLLNYRINIIDTPGFGDVRGLLRDNQTVDQIRQLVEETGQKGVQNLDSVCFLVKAPDYRLTVIQKYMFHAIMSLLGHNMKDNICTIITFADGSGPPPVMSALKASKLPFGQPFIFNNSALMSDPNEDMSLLFWKTNLHSYEKMFSHFENLETKSIHLTKEDLQERRRLDITCQNLQIKLDAGLLAVDSLSQEIKIYQYNEEKIKNNENFTYVVTEQKEVKVTVPDGLSDTYCEKCNETCHRSCWITYESLTGWCRAMNWLTGNCRVCSGKCHWRHHKNRPYRIDISYEEVTKTYEDMQKQFQEASGIRITLEEILKKLDAQLDHEAYLIETMLIDMLKCMNRLAENALGSSPYEMTDLFDLLICTEMHERGQGLKKSVDNFQEKKLLVKQALGATLYKS